MHGATLVVCESCVILSIVSQSPFSPLDCCQDRNLKIVVKPSANYSESLVGITRTWPALWNQVPVIRGYWWASGGHIWVASGSGGTWPARGSQWTWYRARNKMTFLSASLMSDTCNTFLHGDLPRVAGIILVTTRVGRSLVCGFLCCCTGKCRWMGGVLALISVPFQPMHTGSEYWT